jgi:hypothetical protein
MDARQTWGGARPGAGRPHEHQEYLMVEVVDFWGDKDVIVVGPAKRGDIPNKWAEEEAHNIAAHHVDEQARSVKIVKRMCCIPKDAEVVEIVKE